MAEAKVNHDTQFYRIKGEGIKVSINPVLVHVPNFGGVAGSEDFACATLPTTPLDFQGKI